jgi:drug/metabolite transporter (DMT)-like permease
MAVCVRIATRTMEPAQVAFVRFCGSFVLLLVLSRGQGLRPRAESHARLAVRAVLGTVAISLYFVGIGWAGAGLATLLHSTHPVWTALFSVLFMGEAFTPRIALALGANVLGAAAVVGTELRFGTQVGMGCIAALTAGMLAGGSVATASTLRRTESATLITTYFMGIGSVILAPSLLAGTPPWSADLVITLVAVVVTSAAGQWLLHHGLGFTSPVAGSLAAATSIVTASGLEALAIGEHVPARVALAAVFMVSAVGLANARPRPADTASRPTAPDR